MRRAVFKSSRRRGNMVVEAAIWIPIATLLLVGMVQIGRVTYTYYTLRKALYSIGQYLSSQQAADFCNNPGDPAITAAINFGVTGTTDNSSAPLVTGLTAAMISVTPENYDSASQSLSEWDPSTCVTGAGGTTPQFIVVSIPAGYTMQVRIPTVPITPVLLKPVVKVPYGG
jgi:hypothetical protein